MCVFVHSNRILSRLLQQKLWIAEVYIQHITPAPQAATAAAAPSSNMNG